MRKKSGMILAAFAATVALGAASDDATAEQMGAYLLFELTGSDTAAVIARLESRLRPEAWCRRPRAEPSA